MRFSATTLQTFDDYVNRRWEVDEQYLVDYLNGVKKPPSESMERGTAFGELTANIELGEMKDGEIEYKGFRFKLPVVEEVSRERHGGIHEAYFTVPYKSIELHGFIDTLHPNLVLEIKTTSRYDDLRYMEALQKAVYLVGSRAKRMRYVITDFDYVYYEDYTLTNRDIEKLDGCVSGLIMFANAHNLMLK